jgi:hypothetical protein
MFQAIQIETQSEQQGLALLCAQRTAWRTSQELALHRREQRFDQGPTPPAPLRECPAHLGAHSVDKPRFLPTLGGDHTVRPELLPDIGVIFLAVEFGVGQHQSDAGLLGSGLDDGGQIRAVVPRDATRELRQHELRQRELLIQSTGFRFLADTRRGEPL